MLTLHVHLCHSVAFHTRTRTHLRELWLPVRSQVFITEAAGDLRGVRWSKNVFGVHQSANGGS